LTLAQQNKMPEEVQYAWTERTAFHMSQADRFKEAAEYYAKLLSGIEKRGDENTLKALLMQGWSLMKAGQIKQAANAFDKVIVLADKSKMRKASGEPNDVLEFRPQRYSALAFGLLTQMSKVPAARIPLRGSRMKLMAGWENSLSSYALSKENWSRFILKDCTSQATDLWLSGDHAGAGRQLDECLQRLAIAVEDSGETADESALETLRVTWMLASRLAEKNVSLSATSMDTYLLLSRRALSKLDSLAGASRPMAVRWLRLSAEQSVLRSALLSSTKPAYIKPADAAKALQQIAASDRLELLNADERQTLAVHLAGLQERLNRVGQGK
jgi:tetratricopeptide (TPR) repeat protein